MIDSADAFARLLADPAATRTQLVNVRVSSDAVWWEILAKLPFAAAWVAANRSLPVEVVEHLAAHPLVQVRACIASGPCMNEAVMLQLAHDKNELIRVRLVCNAQASREVLVMMAADACQLVSAHAQARLVHDISGVALPASYLDDVQVLDLLH